MLGNQLVSYDVFECPSYTWIWFSQYDKTGPYQTFSISNQ